MARPRTERIIQLKAALVARLQHGFEEPGGQFLSTRALVKRHGISYQTAHRLLDELCHAGWLERRHGSGTYIAGRVRRPGRALLLFHSRARRADSFGAHLLQLLSAALSKAGLPYELAFGESKQALDGDVYPVTWEIPSAATRAAAQRRYCLMLHDRPLAGIAGSFIDSVSADDFSGGHAAAETIERLAPEAGAKVAVLAGPREDRRSALRVQGFLHRQPRATVVYADGWYYESGRKAAPLVLRARRKPRAVFCANDRLAEALLDVCAERGEVPPEVIGFDDAPVAESRGFNTIANPWKEIVAAAVEIIGRRLGGDTSTACWRVYAPRPIVRRQRVLGRS